MRKHHTFAKIVNYAAILFAALPLLSNLISTYLGGVVYVGIACMLAFLVLFTNTKTLTGCDKQFACGMFFFLVFLSIYSFGTQLFSENYRIQSNPILDLTVTLNNYLINLPIYISCFFVFFKSDSQSRSKYYTLYFYCLLYTICITFIALLFVPEYSKNETAGTITDEMRIFSLLGASGFNLTYGLSIILPVFFYLFKRTKRIVLLFVGLLGTAVVIASGFLIASLIMVGNYILCLLVGIKSRKVRVFSILIFLGIVIYFLVNIELIGEFALFASKNIGVASISRRLVQVSNAILYNDYSGDAVSGRLVEYAKSFNGILNHPILGNNLLEDSFIESGHSTIMDAWASFGIATVIVLAISLCYFYYGAVRKEKRRNARNIIAISMLCFILTALFNPITASASLFIHFLVAIGFFSHTNNQTDVVTICKTFIKTNICYQ